MPETGWTVPFDLSRVGEKGCAASTCTAGFGNPAGSAAHCLLVLQALAVTASASVGLLVPRGSGSFSFTGSKVIRSRWPVAVLTATPPLDLHDKWCDLSYTQMDYDARSVSIGIWTLARDESRAGQPGD